MKLRIYTTRTLTPQEFVEFAKRMVYSGALTPEQVTTLETEGILTVDNSKDPHLNAITSYEYFRETE